MPAVALDTNIVGRDRRLRRRASKRADKAEESSLRLPLASGSHRIAVAYRAAIAHLTLSARWNRSMDIEDEVGEDGWVQLDSELCEVIRQC